MLKPGIHYDVPFDVYLNGSPDHPAVSGSDLVAFETECAAHAYANWRCNPDRIRRDATPAMTLGSAAHCLILEGGDAFRKRYAVKPEGMSFSSKEGKAWRDAHADREIISTDDHERIAGMVAALHAQPRSAKILRAGGYAELTMVATDPDTGLTLLCRPDWFIPGHGIAANLKTTMQPAPEAFRRTVASLRYDLGDAMYRHVARLCGVENPTHCFMVVGSQAPHLSYVAALSAEAAANADLQLHQILRRFADCVASNKWHGYSDDAVFEIGLPAYAANQIATRIQEGIDQ